MDSQNKNIYAIGLVVIVLVALLAVGGGLYLVNQNSEKTEEMAEVDSQPSPISQDIPAQPEQSTNSAQTISYKDGKYSVTGEYTSPGGAEELGVDITLVSGVITNAEVEVKATRTISKQKQEDFKANFKSFVIGKNINDVQLSKVSGSSLTPKGFNDALEKIKAEAGV